MHRRIFMSLLIASVSSSAVAQNLVTNGDFEIGPPNSGVVSVLGGDSTTLPGWTVGGGGIDIVTHPLWGGSNGSATSIDLSYLSAGSISQQVATTASVQYRLTFDYAASPDANPPQKALEWHTESGGLEAYSVLQPSSTGVPNTVNWTPYSVDITAGAAQTMISFTSQTGTPFGPLVDNVSLVPLGILTQQYTFTGQTSGTQIMVAAPAVLPPFQPGPPTVPVRCCTTIITIAQPGAPITPPDPRAEEFWKVTTFLLTFGLKKGIKRSVVANSPILLSNSGDQASFEGDGLDLINNDRVNPTWNTNPFTFTGTFTDTDGTVTTETYLATSQQVLEPLNYFAVPEPSSWALLIAGFGLTGAVTRRRRMVAA